MSKKPTKQQVEHPAFEVGRTACRAGISRDDAPYVEGDEHDAWLAGYDFEAPRKPDVEASDAKAVSQVDTASSGGKSKP
jgi:ribosome modulation factor